MNFFKKLLGKTTGSTSPATVAGFWDWFLENEVSFFNTIRSMDSQIINDRFLNYIVPQLQDLNPQFYCETGMANPELAELVITAEGDIKTFVFVEELVAAAPDLSRWKFTALKPPTGIGCRINLNGASFDSDTIRFFYDEDPQYPDEINLTMVHGDFGAENKQNIAHGCLLYLDALLGEWDVATLIDNIRVDGPQPADRELIPMEKLNDFLRWKEKEFVEKYDGTRHNTESDAYSALEGSDDEGLSSAAIINTSLLQWDAKASHPWMMVITIDYQKNNGLGINGMPKEKQYQAFNRLQDDLDQQLADTAGYLSLGRQTYKGESNIYVACREFRHASKVADRLIRGYQSELVCRYDIYKDKYWRTMNPFQAAV
jgi:hypothetical protein